MSITNEALQGILKLAYLNIDDSEYSQLAGDVNAIMNLVDQLKQVDTNDVSPLFHPLGFQQRLRDDEVTETNCCDALAAIAPLFEEQLYLVPKVIDAAQS